MFTPAIPGLAEYAKELAPPANGQLLTYEQVAELLQVSVQTVYNWIRKGCVPSPTRLGSTTRFSREWFEEIKREGLMAPGTYLTPPSPRSLFASRRKPRAKVATIKTLARVPKKAPKAVAKKIKKGSPA